MYRDVELGLSRNCLEYRSNSIHSKLSMVVVQREIGWRLAAEEALSWAGSCHMEEEQACLGLASVGVADNLRWEHMGSAVETLVEEHRDFPMEQLQEKHTYSMVGQALELHRTEPEG